MVTADDKSEYFVLDSEHPDMMLLFPPQAPSLRDNWLFGTPFTKPPKSPVVVRIRPGHEQGQLLDYFGSARLMSNAFHEALVSAGVDNLDVYEAVLQSENGKTQIEGYKAFNVIGMVAAADMAKTRFNDPDGSQLIDASIDSLALDASKTHGLLMFRLAQYAAAVIVHDKVRRVIESRNFPNITFVNPSDFWSG